MDYFMLKEDGLLENSRIPIVSLGTAGEVFYEMALDMIDHIKANNQAGKRTVFICPVGPVGQYPIFVRLVNQQKVSLKDVWFFNMDEYLTDDDKYIEKDSRLSFRGFMDRTVYSQILPELVMPEAQRIFPDPANPAALDERLESLGGADVCYGGIGITGHLAFNEPEAVAVEEFARRPTRLLDISPETRAVNSIGRCCGRHAPPLHHHRDEVHSGGEEAAALLLPGLASGGGAAGWLRRDFRQLPSDLGPEPSRRPHHHHLQRGGGRLLADDLHFVSQNTIF